MHTRRQKADFFESRRWLANHLNKRPAYFHEAIQSTLWLCLFHHHCKTVTFLPIFRRGTANNEQKVGSNHGWQRYRCMPSRAYIASSPLLLPPASSSAVPACTYSKPSNPTPPCHPPPPASSPKFHLLLPALIPPYTPCPPRYSSTNHVFPTSSPLFNTFSGPQSAPLELPQPTMPSGTPARSRTSGNSSSPLPPPLRPTTPGDASEKRSSLRIRLIQDTSKATPSSSAKKRADASHPCSSSSSDSSSDGDFHDHHQQHPRRGRPSGVSGGYIEGGGGNSGQIGRTPGGGLLTSSARDWCGGDVSKESLLQVKAH